MDKLGWTQCRIDSCVWYKITSNGPVYAAVHVDDGLMAGYDVDAKIASLQTEYNMTVNPHPKELLGMQLEIPPGNRGLLGIHQCDHVKKILEFWKDHPSAYAYKRLTIQRARSPLHRWSRSEKSGARTDGRFGVLACVNRPVAMADYQT